MTIAVIISACVFGITALGFMWKISVGVKSASEESEKKRGRIYNRIDEVKNGFKKEFVSKEVYKVTNEVLSRDISEIKKDVKTLLLKSGGV